MRRGRPRQPGRREKHTGDLARSRDYSPTEIRRLRDAALRGMRGQEWGSELGRLYLEGTITAAMYGAGRRWEWQAAIYRSAIGAFPVRSAALERGAIGRHPDPDTDEGRQQVARDRNGAEAFFAAHAALVASGSEGVVRRLVEDDVLPAGMSELRAVRDGLAALARHYEAGK